MKEHKYSQFSLVISLSAESQPAESHPARKERWRENENDRIRDVNNEK